MTRPTAVRRPVLLQTIHCVEIIAVILRAFSCFSDAGIELFGIFFNLRDCKAG